MNKFFKIALILLTIFALVWTVSIARCEYLTYKYYDDFKDAYTANTMIAEVEYFKVLKCDGNYAKVYYISDTGDVLSFTKSGDTWQYNSWWDTVWTTRGGNADEILWPYLWINRKWH